MADVGTDLRLDGRSVRVTGAGTHVVINCIGVHASTGFERIAAYAAGKGGGEAPTKSPPVEQADRGCG
ncbi:hypothetical protein [Streptomyces sp. SID12501]|uniref:hypothetical protein n=1 Tax=Streptomyces sp. SID12501 TaxID=2706042 RepID=UPI0019436821|nr:hypothetical protein [Streptomyces sp. SID12501]